MKHEQQQQVTALVQAGYLADALTALLAQELPARLIGMVAALTSIAKDGGGSRIKVRDLDGADEGVDAVGWDGTGADTDRIDLAWGGAGRGR
jgi:hypothetical protein